MASSLDHGRHSAAAAALPGHTRMRLGGRVLSGGTRDVRRGKFANIETCNKNDRKPRKCGRARWCVACCCGPDGLPGGVWDG